MEWKLEQVIIKGTLICDCGHETSIEEYDLYPVSCDECGKEYILSDRDISW